MQKALKGVPEKPLQPPEGVISVRVSPETGLRDDTSNVSEFFFAEFPPAGRGDGLVAPVPTPGRTAQDVRDQLF
jgi:membrane carboxypeptidase/penicillin-binding protein